MNEFNQKIEFARESYSIKFLNEKFENKDDNKSRKDKLDKILEENAKKQFKTQQKI